MYAIIEVGARQYKITKGEIIEVEKLKTLKDKEITLDKVLLVSKDNRLEIGNPFLDNVKVRATVLRDIKARKTTSFKYRRRKSSHWKKGHRQQFTRLKIEEIIFG